MYDNSQEEDHQDTSLKINLEKLEFEERYTSKTFINEGAMKKIYRCKDLSTGREVAFAVPKSNEQAMEESFLREANISASLQHPNIIPVYDIGLHEGQPYFVMKMIYGKSLSDIIFREKEELSLNNLLNIFIKVCEATSYTHSKGIIHLDLKPSNIQISNYGEVLICDWGLSKVINWEQSEQDNFMNDEAFFKADTLQTTLFGYIKGTPGYLSPEQARGSKTTKSYASDIYSLGAILYAILSKEAPISDNKLEVIIAKTIKGEIAPPRSIDKSIPTALEAICLKAMQVKEEDRYTSVEELIKDIELYLTGFAPKAQKVNLIQKAYLSIRRKPALFASLIASLSLIAIISSSASIKLQQKSSTLAQQKEEIEAQKNEIESQKDEIEIHLDEVQKSKRQLEEIADLAAHEAFEQASHAYMHYHFKKARRLIDTATSLDPENILAKELKLEMSLVHMEKEKVRELYEDLKKHPSSLANVLNTAPFVLFDKNTPPEDMLKLLKHIPSGWEIARKLTFIYNQESPHSAEKMQTFPEALKIHNPGQEINFSWKYLDGKYDIDLSDNPNLKKLYLLSGLNIQKLNLSSSKNVSFAHFTSPKLEYLDLSNSVIHPWEARHFNQFHFPKLETLILDYYTSPEKTLDGLRNTNIKHISLRHTQISSFNFLFAMKKLEKITLDHIPKKFPNGLISKVELAP